MDRKPDALFQISKFHWWPQFCWQHYTVNFPPTSDSTKSNFCYTHWSFTFLFQKLRYCRNLRASFYGEAMEFWRGYLKCSLFVSLCMVAGSMKHCESHCHCSNATSLTLINERPGRLPEGMFCKSPHLRTDGRSKLRCLCITQDNIQDIHQNAFKCLDKLRHLTLCDCSITFLRKGTFQMLHRLEYLNLAGKLM